MASTLRRRVLDSVRPADRAIVAVIGVFNAYFAWYVANGPGVGGIPAERAWAAVFAAAALSCLLLEVRFLSRDLLALSGALTAVAYASRVGVLVIAMTSGHARIEDARVQAGAAIWLTLTFVVAYIWVRVLRPLLELRRLA